ncbi:MAG: mechanosensitive ion channel family protein [Acidobacteriota bacterium]|nr:mechanosensitive ion channel family protein [Acidobacteriota bacterium]
MRRFEPLLVHEWWKWVVPLGVFLLCLIGGLIVRHVLFGFLQRWAGRGNSRLAPILKNTLRGPLVIWSLILGADLATRSSEVPTRYIHEIDIVLLGLWIVSLTIIAANVAGNLVRFYGSHVSGHVSGQAAASASLSRNLAQIAVYTLGMLVLLNHLGVDIRPLLTALGVGGLAVALALQDTMANLFAGFYISVAGQIRLGDYVKLNSGEEGYVADITWRSTTLRGLTNNYVFVPNSKLGQANVTNYDLPNKTMGFSLNVRVAYDCDLDRVEQILLEEAQAGAKEIPGMVAEATPSVTLIPGFTDSALVFSVNVTIADFFSQTGVQSELRRRIFRRFQREGISMAAPTQTIGFAHRGQKEAEPKTSNADAKRV